MRIITGKARGIKLLTLEGEHTRPTSERAKEGIFSMLQFDIEGRDVLDLFAGSGQMGLEALSRGASSAVLVDGNKDAVGVIKKNVEKTGLSENCTVIFDDALGYLRKNEGRKFDIVFLDPPYASELINSSLDKLISGGNLKETSCIVCESGQENILSEGNLLRFDIIKKVKYGVAHILVLRPMKGN